MEMNFNSIFNTAMAMMVGVLPMVIGYLIGFFVLILAIAAIIELVHMARRRDKSDHVMLNLTGRKLSRSSSRRLV